MGGKLDTPSSRTCLMHVHPSILPWLNIRWNKIASTSRRQNQLRITPDRNFARTAEMKEHPPRSIYVAQRSGVYPYFLQNFQSGKETASPERLTNSSRNSISVSQISSSPFVYLPLIRVNGNSQIRHMDDAKLGMPGCLRFLHPSWHRPNPGF